MNSIQSNIDKTERIARERLRVLEEMGKVCDSIRDHLSTKKSSKDRMKGNDLLNQKVRTMTLALRVSGTEEPLKKCSCGKEYKASEWYALTLVGHQTSPIVSGEMRNCPCNSTLLVITKRPT